MIAVRRSDERGRFDYGWLDTAHTFSFGSYHDPKFMGFRSLRVINDDRVAPGGGFGMHGHRDMEIITLVLDGELEHRDGMGHRSIVATGEFQRMTAGTGIRHSEANPSNERPVHLLQIWIEPERRGLTPSYEQRRFDDEDLGRLRLATSRDGREGSLWIHQDVDLYTSVLEPGEQVVHRLNSGRHAWVHVATGAMTLNGYALRAGDGAAISNEEAIELRGAAEGSRVLVFDLA